MKILDVSLQTITYCDAHNIDTHFLLAMNLQLPGKNLIQRQTTSRDCAIFTSPRWIDILRCGDHTNLKVSHFYHSPRCSHIVPIIELIDFDITHVLPARLSLDSRRMSDTSTRPTARVARIKLKVARFRRCCSGQGRASIYKKHVRYNNISIVFVE